MNSLIFLLKELSQKPAFWGSLKMLTPIIAILFSIKDNINASLIGLSLMQIQWK
jgi:hypothetical protein